MPDFLKNKQELNTSMGLPKDDRGEYEDYMSVMTYSEYKNLLLETTEKGNKQIEILTKATADLYKTIIMHCTLSHEKEQIIRAKTEDTFLFIVKIIAKSNPKDGDENV